MFHSQTAKIILSIILCLILGFASGLSSGDSIQTWYAGLNKPFFNPPNWLFAPVWTILYILLGIAVGRVWHNVSTQSKSYSPVYLFISQFILNLLWTYLFFGLQNPVLGLIDISILLILIILTIGAFRKVDGLAAKLMIPYLLWVSFATLLNGSILFLNT